MTDLARLFEGIQRADGFLVGRLVIRPVDQEQVDEVGLKATQAVLRVCRDVRRRGIPAGDRRPATCVGVVPIGEPDLGDHDHVLASRAQTPGKQFLRRERAVDLGRVEQGDAAVDGHLDGAYRLLEVDLAVLRGPHLPSAEADDRALEVGVAEVAVFHGVPFRRHEHRRLSQPVCEPSAVSENPTTPNLTRVCRQRRMPSRSNSVRDRISAISPYGRRRTHSPSWPTTYVARSRPYSTDVTGASR